MTRDLGYRPAVGVMLINRARQGLGRPALDSTLEAWQMPQGGLDRARTRSRAPIASSRRRPASAATWSRSSPAAPEELTYDLPDDLVGKMWKGKWRGQRQTWFLARFLGEDEDVNIETPDPEFRAWKWADPAELPAMIVPFKKKLYEDLIELFADWL